VVAKVLHIITKIKEVYTDLTINITNVEYLCIENYLRISCFRV